MSVTPEARALLLAPLAVWAALLVIGGASLAYALFPGLPAKPVVALALFVGQAGLIAGVLMKLRRAGPLIVVTAIVGTVWLGFLFLMTFADLFTR